MLLKHDRCALLESQLAKRSTKHHKASDQSLRVSGHKHPEQFLSKANRHCFHISVFTQLKSARSILFILLISIRLTSETSDWLFTAECVRTCCVINLSVISFSLSLYLSFSGYLEYKTSMNAMLANKLFHGRWAFLLRLERSSSIYGIFSLRVFFCCCWYFMYVIQRPIMLLKSAYIS